MPTAQLKTIDIRDLQTITDERGSLTSLSIQEIAGFQAKRAYYLYNSKDNKARGFHAHKDLKQIMICLNGSVDIVLKTKNETKRYSLNKPNIALIINECIWREIENFSENSTLLVLASEEYDEADYIRDYDEYLNYMDTLKDNVQVPYLALNRCHQELELEIKNALEKTLRKNNFILGSEVANFEKEFAKYCSAAHAIGCANGLDAIVLALKALDIGAGDEVLVPANSFVASALAVSLAGATPVFVDCCLKNYAIDIDAIQSKITPKTKAIIPVSLYGIPLDAEKLNAIAIKNNLIMIEDAAQAHGASFFASGDFKAWKASTFSFYPTKNLGALGDGGAVITNDDALASKIRILGNYGASKKYHYKLQGYNSRLDEMQASILSLKLKYLNEWNTRRQNFAKIYFKNLKDLEGIIIPDESLNEKSTWHVFPARILNARRDELIAFLDKNKIGTNIHYPVPIHKQEAYASHAGESYPNAEIASLELLSLPLDPFHRADEIEHVCEKIKEFFKKG